MTLTVLVILVIRLAWVSVALTGVLVHIHCVAEAFTDLRVVMAAGVGNGRRLIAVNGVYNEMAFFAAHTLLLAVALLVTLTQVPPSNDAMAVARNLLAMLPSLALLCNSLRARKARRTLSNAMEAHR